MPRFAVRLVVFVDEDDQDGARDAVRNVMTTVVGWTEMEPAGDKPGDFVVVGAEPLVS